MDGIKEIRKTASGINLNNPDIQNVICTKRLIKINKTITTMESCTSGFIASLITDTEGASSILKGAFVTYCNEAKVMQGVPKEVIDTYGVYSYETALNMALASQKAYNSNYAIGITGSIGRVDPNNKDSVVGEVYFCIVDDKNNAINTKIVLENDIPKTRNEVKKDIAYFVFEELKNIVFK